MASIEITNRSSGITFNTNFHMIFLSSGLFHLKVGDFGLARWQPNGDLGVETRVLGTFG